MGGHKKVPPPLKYGFWYIKFRKLENNSEIVMVLTTYIANYNNKDLILFITQQMNNGKK